MKPINKIIAKLEDLIAILLLANIIVVIFIQVFFRFILNFPLSWTEELSRLSLIWLVFISSVIAYREASHLDVKMFTDKLPRKLRLYLEVVVLIFIDIFSIFLVIKGIKFYIRQFMVISPALNISYAWFYASAPISAILVIFHSRFIIADKIKEIVK